MDSRTSEAWPWDTNMTAVHHAPPWCSSAVRYQTFLLERLGVLEAMFLDSGILEARPWDTNMTAVHHAPPWCSSAVRCQTFLLEYLGMLEALFLDSRILEARPWDTNMTAVHMRHPIFSPFVCSPAHITMCYPKFSALSVVSSLHYHAPP